MLGDGRLRERELVDDVAAHPRLFLGEHPQDPHPHWVGNRLREDREFLVCGRTVNGRLQKLGCLSTLRWAARGRVDGRLGFENWIGLNHRQSSIDDNTHVDPMQLPASTPSRVSPIVGTTNHMASTTTAPKKTSATDLDRGAQALQAVVDLVRVYQFRDRDRICCHDISVTQCHALEALVEHGPM